MRWLPVDNYAGFYEVSDTGLIRRAGKAPGARVGKILKPGIANGGYRYVILSKDGRTAPARVHLVVATAFHGPRPVGHQCNHIDGDKSNNAASNLEWVTPSVNLRHSYAIGIRAPNSSPQRGESNGAAKLTADQVREIRAAKGAPLTQLAHQYGVSRALICLIQNGRRWSHL